MNKFFKEHWYLHFIIGGFIGFVLTKTYDGVPIPVQVFLTIFVSGAIGTLWEWIWGALGKAKVDYIDVLFGITGAVLVFLTTLIF